MLTNEQKLAVKAAETAIQKIVIDLYNDHELTVTDVQVDCRPLANFYTQVFVEGDDFI